MSLYVLRCRSTNESPNHLALLTMVEQRTFLVKNFFEAGSLKVTRKRFAKRFPERRPLALKAICERKF